MLTVVEEDRPRRVPKCLGEEVEDPSPFGVAGCEATSNLIVALELLRMENFRTPLVTLEASPNRSEFMVV